MFMITLVRLREIGNDSSMLQSYEDTNNNDNIGCGNESARSNYGIRSSLMVFEGLNSCLQPKAYRSHIFLVGAMFIQQ